jgi:cholinesterase
MHMFVLFPLSCWLAVGAAYTVHNVTRQQPTVTLSCEASIRGLIEDTYPSVRQFLGIPYAQPPIKGLRWEAPIANQLPPSVNATVYGRSCTQPQVTVQTVFTEDVREFNVPGAATSGEDCLTLSVWTPEKAEDLPVLVFFTGGGWYTGGQNIPYQIPTQWIERTKDLVIVVPK